MAERIDRYELQAQLGQGALGTVYLARDMKLDRDVALKVISPSVASNDTARQLFHREAKAIAKLTHPNIIQLYDYSGQESKEVYLVVERLRGKTLADVVKDKGALDYLLAAAVGYEIALALQHAHGQGIVHRDLKPENIFVEPDGRVVLCDFGVARAYRSAAVHTLASQQTKLAGSPLYMSPEQILDPTAIGPASDLFSLGSVLFYLATAETAFNAPNMHKVLKAVTEGPPGPQLDNNPRIPKDYTAIVKRLLEKDPERRYSSAQQLSDSLLALFASTPHRDTRRLLRRVHETPRTERMVLETTQNVAVSDLQPSHTLVTMTPKKKPAPETTEPGKPIALVKKRKEKSKQQESVLLWSIAISLSIVAIALLTREIDALEPLRVWIRELLRRY